MRWAQFSCLIFCALWLAGCGDSSGSGPSASAGAPGAPPPPGAPAGPPAPSEAQPPDEGNPDGAPPSDGIPSEGDPNGGEAAPGDAAPPDGVPPPDSPDGTPPEGVPPGDSADPSGEPDPNNPEGGPRRPPPPRTLRDQAFAAFRSGNNTMGFNRLHAHFAAVPAAKAELVEKMAWYPGLSRPALAPRIGIAVLYVGAPLDFRGNPMPIGSPQLTSAVDSWQQAAATDNAIGGNRRGNNLAPGSGGVADFNESTKNLDSIRLTSAPYQLNYYLGDFGELLVDALEERMETGEYGPVPQELLQKIGRGRRYSPGNAVGQDGPPSDAFGEPGQPGFGPGGPSGGFDGPGGGPPGFGPPGAPEGEVSEPGSIAGAGLATGSSRPRRWSNRAEDKDAESLRQVRQLDPCILWLGKEDEREQIMKRAEMANIDILAVFSMVLREARTSSLVNNTTTLRIITMKTGKAVTGFNPEPLINVNVEQWRQKEEKGVDPVEREVLKALQALDKILKPAPLPEAVTAQRATKRITDLVAAKPADPLPILVEARYYLSKGLLAESDFTDAAKNLLGDDGYIKLTARANED